MSTYDNYSVWDRKLRMRMAQKEKIYGYAFKAVLSLVLFFCFYNVACILFFIPYNSRKLQARVLDVVSTVKTIVKHAGPKETENRIYKSNLVNKASDSSWANQIKRSNLFAAPTRIKVTKTEEEIVQYEEAEETGNTEIIFKGMADGVAYINIKKEIDGKWREYGFPTNIGERIGKKTIVGGEILDLTTNYVLQDIIYNAQRPVTLNKQIVNLNEDGEFVGTRIVPGETYMKSTSKIKYKDENGIINELWLNDSCKLSE